MPAPASRTIMKMGVFCETIMPFLARVATTPMLMRIEMPMVISGTMGSTSERKRSSMMPRTSATVARVVTSLLRLI